MSEVVSPTEQEFMSSTEPIEHEYEFEVKMTCSGCSGAVDRALANLPGVTYHTVDLDEQKVIVKGPVEYDDVLAKIKKTGKEVLSGKVVV